MSNFFDENPNEMERDFAAPAENVEAEAQAMLFVSEEGGEEASGDGSSSGDSGSGSNP